MKAVVLLAGGMTPVVLLVSVLQGLLSVDAAVATVQWTLAISPALLILDNYRKKIGQNALSMLVLSSGLSSIGIMFTTAGLFAAALATFVNGVLWAVLTVQALMYGGKQ